LNKITPDINLSQFYFVIEITDFNENKNPQGLIYRRISRACSEVFPEAYRQFTSAVNSNLPFVDQLFSGILLYNTFGMSL